MAPRYDQRLRRALPGLDDRSQPIAETCRRAGDFADRIGVTRPSYPHIRRLVVAERARRAAIRAVVDGRVDRLRLVRSTVSWTRDCRLAPRKLRSAREPGLVVVVWDLARPARAGPRA